MVEDEVLRGALEIPVARATLADIITLLPAIALAAALSLVAALAAAADAPAPATPPTLPASAPASAPATTPAPAPAPTVDAAVVIAAGQLPRIADALRGRGLAERDLIAVINGARAAAIDPPELVRILQAIIAAPPGPKTMNLGTWLSGQIQAGLRGRELRRALGDHLRGVEP